LLGSTVKMGTGTNVQDRLIAAHHLDCPWRPSDVTQRDGRILRQGNRNETVQIFRYVTKGTFDAYLWQIQEQKLRYISQVMTGKSITRSCEDADETVLSAAEVKAVATGNPMLAEKMHVDNEVSRLKLLKTNWQNEQLILERKIQNSYPLMLKTCEEKHTHYLQDIETWKQHHSSSFTIELDGKRYEERTEAGEVLLLLANLTEVGHQAIPIGQYSGFPLALSRTAFQGITLHVQGVEHYSIELGESPIGNMTRLENLLAKLPTLLQENKESKERILQELSTAQNEVGKPFEDEEQLQQLVARQSEINSALEFKELQDQGNVLSEDIADEIATDYSKEAEHMA